MEKHFVHFLSPGSFVSESNTFEVKTWNVSAAKRKAKTITQRYGAVPYCFYFTTEKGGGKNWEPKETDRSHMYYLPHCKIETLAQIKKRNDPKDRILISNMEINGYPKVVTTTKGWKITVPFREDDILLSR